MRFTLATLLVATLLLAGCSKEKKTIRQLDGTWDVVHIEGWQYSTGECGYAASQWSEWSDSNVGTYEFSKEPGRWTSIFEDTYAGQMKMTYDYLNANDPVVYTANIDMEFEWYIATDDLIISNPDEGLYVIYSLEDFDKKSWPVNLESHDGSGCGGFHSGLVFEKQ